MAKSKTKKKRLDGKVLLLNPFTCGIYKDGGTRFKVDPATGKRSKTEIDNELGEHVDTYLAGKLPPGAASVPLRSVFNSGILVPRYYDARWNADFETLVERLGVTGITIGELQDKGILQVRGGHGSPSNDMRTGNIPYIKVSDIRSLRVNVNPTNLVPRVIAEKFWRGKDSGLKAWDLVTPNRASSNIGEFAMLLPGEEQVVVTKEVFVFRLKPEAAADGWTPFYLHWALCLKAVRKQWQRIALMQTNREDVAARYREVLVPNPPDAKWAEDASKAFRDFFTTLADAKAKFLEALSASSHEYIASAHSAGGVIVEEDAEEIPPEEPLADLLDLSEPGRMVTIEG